jgi:hypothetical protein
MENIKLDLKEVARLRTGLNYVRIEKSFLDTIMNSRFHNKQACWIDELLLPSRERMLLEVTYHLPKTWDENVI